MDHRRATPEALDALFAASDVRHPCDSLGFLVWQVTHAWQRHVEERLEPFGLTHLQFVVLISTAWHMKQSMAPSQAMLARWAQIHPMQISQVVKLLMTKGLLLREKMPSDARVHRLALTAEGLARLGAAVPVMKAAHHSFFDAVCGTEEPLKALLARLFEHLSAVQPLVAQQDEHA
jgi:DNA-binding MarR family transcriptional regulator